MLSRLGERIRVEAAIVFGSWARGGGGEWSDVDLLVVSSDVASLGVLDRFSISVEYAREGVDLFIYTIEELESMVRRGNPLALSALVEGVPVVTCERVERLRLEASSMYRRLGRAWVRVG
ncbi:MAG: nucleotidyltransferase domain-containing protein [Desulfurococcaceae archaeon]|nr:nucleotidyltransferase domain-containing protein [Desulfurococcaceae archaeon]